MNRKKIYILIALMSLALLGLIGFQLYWIRNAVQLSERQFEQEVQQALTEVVQRLEKQEIISMSETLLKSVHFPLPAQHKEENVLYIFPGPCQEILTPYP